MKWTRLLKEYVCQPLKLVGQYALFSGTVCSAPNINEWLIKWAMFVYIMYTCMHLQCIENTFAILQMV